MSIFPFISPEVYKRAETPDDELPLFKEFAYDYENNALLLKRGMTYLVEGNEALKIWIYKALLTHRFRHTAYSRAYGNEAQKLLGYAMGTDVLKSELRRYIIEALMVNPYILELSNFQFEFIKTHVIVHFDCTTIYGEMGIEYLYERRAA